MDDDPSDPVAHLRSVANSMLPAFTYQSTIMEAADLIGAQRATIRALIGANSFPAAHLRAAVLSLDRCQRIEIVGRDEEANGVIFKWLMEMVRAASEAAHETPT